MRIIAGEFRGRRLVAPKGRETRPTTDRVREAWFSILGPIRGVAVDLYAGTGALGFEALSRGASHVVFVEAGRPAQIAIERNAETLGVTQRVTLLKTTVEAATKIVQQRGPFDLVLTDPPWTHLEQASRALGRVLKADLLTDRGQLVLGHPKGRPILLPEGHALELELERSWGDSAAGFYGRAAADAPL